MSETKKFKTESKRLLDLMTNSIYTNREIFLRELISNASDAIDKYHYLSLNDENLEKRDNYEIRIDVDKDKRTICISDNGIGMTHDEIVNNLGTIAKSGSLEFLNSMSEEDLKNSNIDVIGQFGVGFYSSFMVAKKVVVETRSPFENQGYRFTSEGTETYKIEEIQKDQIGSSVTLFLKDNVNEEDFNVYLEQYKIESLVKKYSDYIRYPIKMKVKKEIGEKDEKKEVEEDEILNSMIPLWKKNKSEVTTEQLNEFYQSKFNDFEPPLMSLFINTEGIFTYQALVFIPAHAPYDLYSDKYQKGLQLYSKGVFIKDKCDELVPDYLRFIKGLVDSSDLSLNISREILQQNSQLKKIASNIEKKILAELEKMKNEDFEKYSKFFEIYGINFKYGIYDNFGEKKDALKDLVLYHSIKEDKFITLKQYKEAMKEKQEFIYYATGKSKTSIKAMPQMDMMKKFDYDVLIFSDDIDEFAIQILNDYDGIKFKSIASENLDLLDQEEDKKLDELKENKKSLIDKIKEILKDQVDDVVFSKRLVDSPVCLVSGEGLSLEMEKVLNNLPNSSDVKAKRILEINPNHELFKAIETIFEKDEKELDDYASVLYNQALLIEGMPLKDPLDFSNKICKLMIKAAK